MTEAVRESWALVARTDLEAVAKLAEDVIDAQGRGESTELLVLLGQLKFAIQEARK